MSLSKWLKAAPKKKEILPINKGTTNAHTVELTKRDESTSKKPSGVSTISNVQAHHDCLRQPKDISFPFSAFGKEKNTKKLCFQPSWYQRFPWLEYDVDVDSDLCCVCRKAERVGMLTTHYKEAVFTEKGFRNWKKALEENKGFKKHQQSEAYKAATLGIPIKGSKTVTLLLS